MQFDTDHVAASALHLLLAVSGGRVLGELEGSHEAAGHRLDLWVTPLGGDCPGVPVPVLLDYFGRGFLNRLERAIVEELLSRRGRVKRADLLGPVEGRMLDLGGEAEVGGAALDRALARLAAADLKCLESSRSSSGPGYVVRPEFERMFRASLRAAERLRRRRGPSCQDGI